MSSARILHALVRAAADVTGGLEAWLLATRAGGLEVVAALRDGADDLTGRSFPSDRGSAGMAASLGQPMARRLRADDPLLAAGVLSVLGRPVATLLSVPCDDGQEVRGVLEVVDKYEGGFTVDDVEVATVLAGVAAIAIAEQEPSPPPPTPAELHAALQLAADKDPSRYAAVATAVAALLTA